MPYASPPQRPLDPVRLQPPVYMANGPMYVIFYPCPCGLGPCVQPVLVNSHHIRALHAAQQGGIINIPAPIANDVIPDVLDRYVVPPHLRNLRIPNEFADEYVVDQEPNTLEYPTYPEVQPREYRRRNRARRSRKMEAPICWDSDESDVDR